MKANEFQDPFVRALTHLEKTLTATHIAAFPVWWCLPTEDVVKVRADIAPNRRDFSHVPIRDDTGRIRWIAERENLEGKHGRLVDHAVPVAERNVIDAGRPLRDTVLLLREQGFLLVRSPESGQPDWISGIINHADVQKTPVRLLLFAQLTEIEARLRDRLTRESWEEDVACAPFVKMAKAQCRDHRARLPLINHLNPKQLMLLGRARGLPLFPYLSEEEFKLKSCAIYSLRNDIAHTNDFGEHGNSDPLETIDAVNRSLDLVNSVLSETVGLSQAANGDLDGNK